MMGRKFTERMANGKQRAIDKRNRGLASGQHESWERVARARAEAARNDPDEERAYHRLQHIQALAALELFHNIDAKQAVEEFCRSRRIVRAADIPF